MIKSYLKKYIKKLIYPNTYSSEAYVNYLKNRGCKIGNNTYFFGPRNTEVDFSRPEFIEIGDNCKISRGVIILAHDYSYSVLCNSHNTLCPTSDVTKIGNNVFIGMNSIILMGSNIGNNVIIGAGSIVKGNIPDNSVFAGNPARKICTLDDYKIKLSNKIIENAKCHAKRIYQIKGRMPYINEMGYYSWLFTNKEHRMESYTTKLPLCGNDEGRVLDIFLNMNNVYNSFDDFLNDIE